MNSIIINTIKPYKYIIGYDILKDIASEITKISQNCNIVIITDSNVDAYYAKIVEDSLKLKQFRTFKFVIHPGEASKSLDTYERILNFLVDKEINNSDIILSLGGGIVGDISGFLASTYLRGINFIQVPTTFLAAVDSSIGGKTALNLDGGKNLVGTFYQPSFVYCDCMVFDTLSDEIFSDGVAEVIKYGIIADEDFFNFLFEYDIKSNIDYVVNKCVRIKNLFVSHDEFDKLGKRQFLNFGHTIAHAIERCSNFEITHGRAVAMGMAMITKISKNLNFCSKECYDRIMAMLDKYRLPINCNFDICKLREKILLDKKRKGDYISFIIPTKIGSVKEYKINCKYLLDFLSEINK